MKVIRRGAAELDLINPYIALTDVLINLVLIFVFFAAAILFMGRLGKDDIKYRSAQRVFKTEMEKAFPDGVAWNDLGRNDPPGAQRWVFTGKALFEPGKSVPLKGADDIILRFASLLRNHKDKWRRIRIEGHTIPPAQGDMNDWDLSARRASQIARLLSGPGHIPAHFLSVAARGGQNPIFKGSRNAENDRVEFVIEYSKIAATGETLTR